MDEKTFDKVYNAVRILIKEQKQQSLKISELEKRIEKMTEHYMKRKIRLIKGLTVL